MLRWMNRSTAGGKSRAEKIAAMVEKIAGSDLSVDEFFRRYTVPFSRPQYFRYQARLAAQGLAGLLDGRRQGNRDRKSTRLNSSHSQISYAVFCLKKKRNTAHRNPYFPILLVVHVSFH